MSNFVNVSHYYDNIISDYSVKRPGLKKEKKLMGTTQDAGCCLEGLSVMVHRDRWWEC